MLEYQPVVGLRGAKAQCVSASPVFCFVGFASAIWPEETRPPDGSACVHTDQCHDNGGVGFDTQAAGANGHATHSAQPGVIKHSV